jgi:hypothetical protein
MEFSDIWENRKCYKNMWLKLLLILYLDYLNAAMDYQLKGK